jgi:hypothetical protein
VDPLSFIFVCDLLAFFEHNDEFNRKLLYSKREIDRETFKTKGIATKSGHANCWLLSLQHQFLIHF